MHNVTLKDIQVFLAITTRGVSLDQLTHLIPDYKDAFDSSYRDALGSLFRLEHAGLIAADKIHIDDWDASHIDVKLNDHTIDQVLADNWYQYEFHVSKKGRECRKNIQTQFRDTLFGKPQEAVIYRPAVKKNAVNIVTRFEPTPAPIEPELVVPDFNANPDCVAHKIIDTIKSWTNILETYGVVFEETQFSKAYDSYKHLFDELIAGSYNKQDIARAVYLMEDVVDMEDDVELWNRAGLDLIETVRSYTPCDREIRPEWADGITFMTIPEPTHTGLAEVLHYMSLRFQEIDNGDYKQHNRWHGIEQTDESKFTDDELLVDELETLVRNGYMVLAHIANYVSSKDPRSGYTDLRVWKEFVDQQGYQKKEFQIIINASKALQLLDSSFTTDEFCGASNLTSNFHCLYVLEKLEKYGFIKKAETSGEATQFDRYLKVNF